MSRITIKLFNVVNNHRNPGMSFTLSGICATIQYPNGAIHEAVFDEGFTQEEIIEHVLNDFRINKDCAIKVERTPQKFVTYYFKDGDG